jgi:primase-polymerase (primpol)-like protein
MDRKGEILVAIVTDRMGGAKGRAAPRTKAEIETSPERPKALRVRPEGIPAELREIPQWVCWRYEWREDKQGKGRWTKVPLDPKTGRLAKSTDPATWGTFQQALAYYHSGKADGIGFVFAPDDPFAGVDLDDCRNPDTQTIEPWAAEIVARLKSYAEVSPSGTGVKAFLRGEVPADGHRKGQVEIYDRGRYFAVTGRQLPDAPAIVKRRPKALAQLHDRLFAPSISSDGTVSATLISNSEAPATLLSGKPLGLSDGEIIRKAKAAKSGDRFPRLWAGDTSDYGSHSEADLALCGLLAHWTGPDPERIDCLFRQSGLMRAKWDREDYRRRTIAKALSGRSEFYSPGRNARGHRRHKTKTIRFTVEL